jgi:hypothetical protein
VIYIVLCFLDLVATFRILRSRTLSPGESLLWVGCIVYFVLYILFGILQAGLALMGIFGIVCDIREVEVMEWVRKGEQIRVNAGNWAASCVGVFGDPGKCYLWAFPVPAFHGIDEYLLVGQLSAQEEESSGLPI